VDENGELLFTDLALFNRKIVDWLVFYNTSVFSTRVPKVLDSYIDWQSIALSGMIL